MHSEEDSDDFNPCPLPAKRRRLNRKAVDDIESDTENHNQPSAKSRQRQRPKKKSFSPSAKSPPKKQPKPKPKHLIRVHHAPVELEDQYFTQVPEITSSPSRIRGAIWKKPQHIKVEADYVTQSRSPTPKTTPQNMQITEDEIYDEVILTPVLTNISLPRPNQDVPQEAPSCSKAISDVIISARNNTSRCTTNNMNFDEDDEFEEAFETMPLEGRSEIRNAFTTDPKQGRDVVRLVSTVNHTNTHLSAPSQIDFDIAQELADLPSDAFASSSSSLHGSPVRIQNNSIMIASQNSTTREQNLAGPQKNLRQMTLFGNPAQTISEASQATKRHNFPLMNKNEKPTHHKLNHDAMQTWVYPTNLGTIRDYQFNIVARGLFHNLLVALPTGLGKTFIAATIMLNWFRWTKEAKIIFVAPTRPLVSQQVEACFGIAGIPRSQTSMLTGGTSPGLRAEEYASKRVFFMTPQTIINDLKSGICDPKQVVLLVVDEAHRATGAYAYVEVVKFLRRFNESFRVLALTATPGGSVEAVQEVIDGLDISRVEIRTELSLDIRQYVHSRKTESITFDNSEEMEFIMDLFSKSVQPVLNKLNQFNAYWSRDPMQLTAYGLTQARQRWMGTPAAKNANFAVKGMVNRLFTVLASLAHSIELLKFHGIGPFFHGMVNFRNAQEGSKGGKYEKEILESEHFQKMMTRLQFWINTPTFIGHPKLDYLQGIVLDHFVAAGEGRANMHGVPPSSTRIMIFAHYRDSAEEIVRVLKRNEPMVRPHVFVGQAASKGSEGMDQKKQLEIIQEFKTGKYNTIVATSIGEEGLDIGEVDLIICYDSSASPIRMLQRMGRTGRKRAGKIVLLLMKGKEENSFTAAKDNYEKMQHMIAAGTRFNFHEDLSPRIVPKDIIPIVDKRVVEIPTENTQGDLPEPKKRAGRAPKRPPKKFHMPDGVRTGFVRASRIEGDHEDGDSDEEIVTRTTKRQRKSPIEELEPIPTLAEVLLNQAQKKELLGKYRNFKSASGDETVPQLCFTEHMERQRCFGSTKFVSHGEATKSTVKMLQAMHSVTIAKVKRFEQKSKSMQLDRLCRSQIRVVPDEIKMGTADLPRAATNQNRTRVAVNGKSKPKGPRKTTTASAQEELHAALEAASSSPPRTSPRMQMQSQGISLGSDTSGEDEDEEPDSELRDFVVDDEEMEEDVEATMTSSILTAKVNPEEPFYISQNQVASSSDSELPQMEEILQMKKVASAKVRVQPRSVPKRKRNVVVDSSD